MIEPLHWKAENIVGKESVFPVKFQLMGFVPLTTEKWGYKEQNRGTKQKN